MFRYLFFLFLFSSIVCFSQDNGNVVVSIPNSNHVFVGFNNVVELGFSKKKSKTIHITCSNCDTLYFLKENKWVIRPKSADQQLVLIIKNHKNQILHEREIPVFKLPQPSVKINGEFVSKTYLDTFPICMTLQLPEYIPIQSAFRIRQWKIRIDDRIFSGKGTCIAKQDNQELFEYLKQKGIGLLIFECEYESFESGKEQQKIREVWNFRLSN